MFKAARRYAGGGLLYIVYGSTLFLTCQASVGWVMAREEAESSLNRGLIDDVRDYGWGDHYIWHLVVVCAASYLAAFLAGAMAKKNGGAVASIANIPHIGLRLFVCYSLYTGRFTTEHNIAWGIIYPLSIIGSVGSSYSGGAAGEAAQRDDFGETTVLGLKSYHWFWIWLVENFYILGLCSSVMRFLNYTNTSDVGLFSIIPCILLWLPVLGYYFPLAIMYMLLSGDIMKGRHALIIFVAFIGTWIGGLIVGLGTDWLCIKVLGGLYKIFH